MLYGTSPNYSHLKTFGYLCYTSIPKVHTHKFDPRSVPCVFLGYPFSKKGYKLYNLLSKLTFISRDVIFLEHIFSFSSSSPSLDSLLFPLSSISPDIDHYPPATYPFYSTPSLPTTISTSPDSCPIVGLASAPAHSLRRSSRSHNPPSYLQDFQCSLPSTSSSLTSISTFYANSIFEPYTYSQAATIPEWKATMSKEFETLEANHIWFVVKILSGKKPIICKWV